MFLGGKKKNIPFRRQRMEIDCLLPLSVTPAGARAPAGDDLYIADLLKVADENIARLREEARVGSEDRISLQTRVDSLRKQVRQRTGLREVRVGTIRGENHFISAVYSFTLLCDLLHCPE